MTARIGIRREDKSEWERRVPVTPKDAANLQKEHGVQVVVQPSDIRAFTDEEFAGAGVTVQEDLSACSTVFGIKEMPKESFQPGKAYVFFAHVIKGQSYNMTMLQRMLDQGCTLIDYERVVDDKNRRLIFFGWHAGVAGMINTLWSLGQRLAWKGIPNPFTAQAQTRMYHDPLSSASQAMATSRGGRRKSWIKCRSSRSIRKTWRTWRRAVITPGITSTRWCSKSGTWSNRRQPAVPLSFRTITTIRRSTGASLSATFPT